MDTRKLTALKEKIEAAKSKLNQLQGQEEMLLKELKKDWGVKTAQEARELLEQQKADIKDLEEKLEAKMDELEKAYDELQA